MKNQISNTENVFRHTSGFIRISTREEKHLNQLIENFGTLQNVPPKEEVTACYVKVIKNKFVDTEDYFFFPVNELTPAMEALSERRRKSFLSFKPQSSKADSKK